MYITAFLFIGLNKGDRGMETYKLIVEGKVLEGFDIQQVQGQVCRLFKLEEQPEKLAALFKGRDVVIKRGLDTAQADRYISTLQGVGLTCRRELESQGVAAVTPPPIEPESTPTSLQSVEPEAMEATPSRELL